MTIGLALIVVIIVGSYALGNKKSPEKKWQSRSKNLKKGEKWKR